LVHSDAVILNFKHKMRVIKKVGFDTDKMILFGGIIQTGFQRIPDQVVEHHADAGDVQVNIGYMGIDLLSESDMHAGSSFAE